MESKEHKFNRAEWLSKSKPRRLWLLATCRHPERTRIGHIDMPESQQTDPDLAWRYRVVIYQCAECGATIKSEGLELMDRGDGAMHRWVTEKMAPNAQAQPRAEAKL